jgi:hypothetical protein
VGRSQGSLQFGQGARPSVVPPAAPTSPESLIP